MAWMRSREKWFGWVAWMRSVDSWVGFVACMCVRYELNSRAKCDASRTRRKGYKHCGKSLLQISIIISGPPHARREIKDNATPSLLKSDHQPGATTLSAPSSTTSAKKIRLRALSNTSPHPLHRERFARRRFVLDPPSTRPRHTLS